MTTGDIDISVIIVSYNTCDLTVACLRSVIDQSGDQVTEIIVIDNASKDGTVARLQKAFSEVTIIENEVNRGFAAANNQGLAVAKGRYLLLLNPDTEMHDRCLERTLEFADANPHAGAIGCRSFTPDGSQEPTLIRFPRLVHLVMNILVPNRLTYRNRWLGHARYAGIDFDQVQDIEVICGCFMFVRREVYDKVGGLDEDFFMYGEEVEWCYRIRKAGWRIWYTPNASILHYGGASTKKLIDDMSLALARSKLLVLQKTRGKGVAFTANFLMLLRDLPRAVFWKLVARAPVPRDEAMRAVLRRSAERCGLHIRGLVTLDWTAQN